MATALGRNSLDGFGGPQDDERYRLAIAGFDERGDPQVLLINGMSVEIMSVTGEVLVAVPFRDVRRLIARDRRTLDFWAVPPAGQGHVPAKYLHVTLDDNAAYVEQVWCHSPSTPHLGKQLPQVDFRLEPYLYHLGRVVDAAARAELTVGSLLEALPPRANSEPKRFAGQSGTVLVDELKRRGEDNPGFGILAERCHAAGTRRNQVVHGTFIPGVEGRPSRVVRKYLRGKELRESNGRYQDGPADLLALTKLTLEFDAIHRDCVPVLIDAQSKVPAERMVVPNSAPDFL